jgi:N-acetylglucosaminyl-diphospho-decaprenol L-rhamnosyltransferase
MTDPDLSSITRLIVSYNSSQVIADCLDAIPDQPTVVIDNDSTDNSAQICRQRRNTKVIETGSNAGFGAGVNRGFAEIDTEWALVINPDAILDGANLQKLLECARKYPDAGMIAPAIVNNDGVTDYSHDKALHRRRGMTRKRLDPLPEGPVCAEFLSGAAFMVRTEVAKKIGGFDQAFFLFYEDDDFCWRIVDAGSSLILEPAATAMHLGGTSTSPSARIAYRRDYHMGRSLTLYRQKHLGLTRAVMMALTDAPALCAKALLRSLTGNWTKAARDWGRLNGTLSRFFN